VRRVVVSPTHKFVLVCLADQANEQGYCWPAVCTIAEWTCLSDRTVQRAIRDLCAAGLLSVTKRSGRSTMYQVHPPQSNMGGDTLSPPMAEGVSGCHPGGVTVSPEGCQSVTRGVSVCHPDPSVIHDRSINDPRPAAPDGALALRPTSKGTRLRPDWALPDEWAGWALAEYPQWDRVRLDLEAARFRDYWCSLAGARATKVDWSGTWRNWCRRASGDDGQRPAVGAPAGLGRLGEAAMAIAASRAARGGG
jgi:hypothetical protein